MKRLGFGVVLFAILILGLAISPKFRHRPQPVPSVSQPIHSEEQIENKTSSYQKPVNAAPQNHHTPSDDRGEQAPSDVAVDDEAETLPGDAIPGEYVLRFYDAHDRAAFEALARQLGAQVLDSSSFGNAVRIRVSNSRLLKELLDKGPTPLDWMRNFYVRIPELGGARPLTPESGYLGFGDKALEWLGVLGDNSNWGRGVTVAVLDSGIFASAALRGVPLSQIDLVNEGGGAGVHGSAVASLIAGRGYGVRGVAPGVDLLSVKVMSDAGVGDAFTLAKGIVEAVNRGAQVIVMSLGSRGDNSIMQAAVAYARDRGVLMVAAAGNDALLGVSYPARYPDVIGVGGVDANGRHLYFSNRGDAVDLTAPGAGVSVALPDGSVALLSGTSVSVPFTAGAAAALLAKDSTLNSDDLRSLLRIYSNDAGPPGADEAYGAGVLDVDRLINHDTAGIYDMAAMIPYLDYNSEKKSLHIDVSAQNRGTETLDKVELFVDWDGQTERFTFFNVRVGDTLSQPYDFPYNATAGALNFKFAVVPVGVVDATPGNNALQNRISLNPPEQKP